MTVFKKAATGLSALFMLGATSGAYAEGASTEPSSQIKYIERPIKQESGSSIKTKWEIIIDCGADKKTGVQNDFLYDATTNVLIEKKSKALTDEKSEFLHSKDGALTAVCNAEGIGKVVSESQAAAFKEQIAAAALNTEKIIDVAKKDTPEQTLTASVYYPRF